MKRHGNKILVIFALVFMCSCSINTYRFAEYTDYSEMTYKWMKLEYSDWEVVEVKDYVYILLDGEGGVYYVECLNNDDMMPTFQKQIQ